MTLFAEVPMSEHAHPTPEWLADRCNELSRNLDTVRRERNTTDTWTVQLAMALGISADSDEPDVRKQYAELRERILAAVAPGAALRWEYKPPVFSGDERSCPGTVTATQPDNRSGGLFFLEAYPNARAEESVRLLVATANAASRSVPSLLLPTHYKLKPGIWSRDMLECCIMAAPQRGGTILWKVRDQFQFGSVLKKIGRWVPEPNPSSRTARFLETTRYASPEEAALALVKFGPPK